MITSLLYRTALAVIRFSLDSSVSMNDPWRHTGLGVGQSNRLRRMMIGWPLPPTRMTSTAAGTSTRLGRQTPTWAPVTSEAVGAIPTSSTPMRGSKGKPLTLEEPYIIQPTAAVFQRLYDLLVRSLSRLHSSESETGQGSARSAVLSLLQIMRANFCRLVDAHVDPAEVGLILDCTVAQHAPEQGAGRDGGESLLPNILHCLQGIMLQQGGDILLLRATVDTFSSGLPLLLPRVQDRLHLLRGLVWHLQTQRFKSDEAAEGVAVAKGFPEKVSVAHDGASNVLAQIPRERVTLLRDLLQHFARTESVLQLLALFEEDETERSAVSDLLELMLTSLADKACPSARGAVKPGEGLPRADGRAGAPEESTYWEHLVASGAGGTTLSSTLLETCQQHLLYMVLNRSHAEDNPHELLLCQYGQCLLQVILCSWLMDRTNRTCILRVGCPFCNMAAFRPAIYLCFQ